MKKGVVVVALIGLVALTGGGARAAAVYPGGLEIHDGLSPPAEAWGAAMQAGDLAALARMHGPDTVTFPPSRMQVTGDAAIMKGYAALFAAYTVRVKTEDTHWVQSGPLIVSWGLTTLTLHPKAGGPDIVSHTRFTDAAVATDDGWRYVVDQASKPTK